RRAHRHGKPEALRDDVGGAGPRLPGVNASHGEANMNDDVTRRRFLVTAGSALGVAATTPGIASGKESTMLIVDAQIHIWKNNKPTNATHRQVADYTAADALKEMDEGGVSAAVIHPPGWDPDSNALAGEAPRQPPNRFAS